MTDESTNALAPEDLPETPAAAGRRLPLVARIFYGVGLFCVLLYALFWISPTFSDFFNRHIASILRWILAKATLIFPFSLAEFLLLLFPILVVLTIWWASRRYADTWRDVWLFCGTVLSLFALMFSIFTVGFASGYRGSSLAEKLSLAEKSSVSAKELHATARYLADEVNRASAEVVYGSDGFSVMPYDFWEMNRRISAAYDKAADTYGFLPRLHSRVKPVMLSKLMSYTHITGVYTFFTGEANLNMNFPDYTLPYTAAHELAHQRGIAREDEANFMAFLVLAGSDDAYLRYCAYLNLYEYVASDLYDADPEAYASVYLGLYRVIRREQAAYAVFVRQYADSVAGTVAGAVNDAYLTVQGTGGVESYNLVVRLAAAYVEAR